MSSRVFIYSHPRTGSNLLAKLLGSHPSLSVKQYPLLDAIQMGPERQFVRNSPALSEHIKEHPRSNKTLQNGLDDMETWMREAEDEGKISVIKEHAYHVMFANTVNAHLVVPRKDLPIPKIVDRFLDVPEDKRPSSQAEAEALAPLPIPNPTFIPDRLFVALRAVLIIRHPAKAIPSFLRASADLGVTIFDENSETATQFKWLRIVYDCYKALYDSQGSNSVFPVVIDGDKLINETEAQMSKLCNIIGIDASQIRYSWDAVDKFDNKLEENFIGTIGRSTGVIRQKDYRPPVLEEERMKWAGEWDEKTAEKMNNFAEQAMGDYQYLLDRSHTVPRLDLNLNHDSRVFEQWTRLAAMPDAPKPSSNTQLYRNSPRKGDSTHHSAYTEGHTNQIRKTNMKTLGDKLPKFDVSYFLESVVPDVPKDKVDEVFQQLINNEMIVYNAATEEHRWCWYDVDPSEMDGSENKVYKHLEDISKAVVDVAKEVWKVSGEQQTVRFTCKPNHASLSDTQNSGFMTDGDQELINNGNPDGGKVLLDSVTTAEFKKKAGTESSNDNVEKLLGNSTHMLSSDPRRRFRFGITIEDTQMRFWYFSRALNYVTHGFNFITNPKPFIQFLLATSFATPAELGYDPTVARSNVDGEWVYDYRVDHPEHGTQWYRTVESLDTHRAARLPGRGVRVWVVKPLDRNRQPYPPGSAEDKRYVLKDYWLPMDSKSEKEISDAIVDAAVAKGRNGADVRKHLMTIMHDWGVSINGQDDNSDLHLRRKMPPSEYEEHILKHVPETPPTQPRISGSVNSVPVGGLDIPEEKSQNDVRSGGKPPVFKPRVHRRLIFEEVGQPLNKIRDQKVLAQCLIEALEGLGDFFLAEYVHRDISSGNLLRCELAGGGYICKISDLEYARPRLVEEKAVAKPHDFKTGTPAFMAVEVQLDHYVLAPRRPIRASNRQAPKPQFLHNYLHDVEGLWWIMMYSLFSTGPVTETLPSPQVLEHRIAKRNELFPVSLTNDATRLLFMTEEDVYRPYVSSLPQSYRALADNMTEALEKLMDLYDSAHRDILKHDSFKDVYATLLPIFEKAKNSGVENVLLLEKLLHKHRADGQPTVTVTPTTSLKRSRATARAGDDDEYVDDSEPATKKEKIIANASTPNGASGSSYQPRRSIRPTK